MNATEARAKEIFMEAVKIPPDRWDSHLDQACAADEDLRGLVNALLGAHKDAGSFLESPAPGLATIDAPIAERPGSVIGPYKLLEQIGEGGFGVVFMAEQQQPIRRKVAIKVLKPGMDSRQVIARFEAERQALALMDHPNIAKVLDAGQTSSGRPYFVMDLVKGLPITDFCDQSQFTPRQRLELFLSVCQAVQHAHQKGIIHRDLKPTNVLVTLHDGRPLVKVIDFGVAKALGQQLTDKTLFTNFAQMIGTPLYMSPEQAAFSNADVDTRSDIYSLGVLLYELLTGTTPFDKERFSKVGYGEICRIIREEEPPKPSTRISTLGQAATTASTQRRSDPQRLSHLFRGELDWIVMKALEKDRNRRYETASAFAADVQHYLHDEPVQACPPSAWYRFRKFARRNRVALSTTAAVVLVVSLAMGGFGWVAYDKAARRIEAERGVEDALVEAATLRDQAMLQPRDAGQHEAAIAAALSAVKRGEQLLAAGGSNSQQQRLAAIRTDLEEMEQDDRMVSRLQDIHLRRGDEGPYQGTFGLGLYATAFQEYGIDVEALEPAVSGHLIRQRAIRLELVAALDSWRPLNTSKDELKRLQQIADIADPDPQGLTYRMRHALASNDGNADRNALIKLAKEARVETLAPITLAELGGNLILPGEADEAVRLLRRSQQQYPHDWWISYELARGLMELKPPQPSEALRYLNAAWALRPRNPQVCIKIGDALRSLDRTDEAAAAYWKAVEREPDSPEAYACLLQLLDQAGRSDEATKLLRQATPSWPRPARTLSMIGQILQGRALRDPAIAVYREAARLQPDSPEAHQKLGDALLFGKDRKPIAAAADEAIAAYEQAIRLEPDRSGHYYSLGMALEVKGRLDEAIAAFQEQIRLWPDDILAYTSLSRIFCEGKHDYDRAIAALSKAVELCPERAMAWNNRGWIYCAYLHQYDKGVADFSKAIELDPKFALAWKNRGITYISLRQYDKAIADYSKAIELDPKGAAWWNSRGAIYCDYLGQYDKAVADFSKAIELDPNGADAWHNRGLAYARRGQIDKAIADFSKAIELDPKHAAAWCGRGLTYGKQGQMDKAIVDSSKAIELDPKRAAWWNSRGEIYCDHLGEYDKAIADCSKAIELDPKYAPAWNTRGMTYIRLRQYDKAIADLNKVIEVAGQSAMTTNNLAWLLATCPETKFRDAGKAVLLAKKAVEMAPKEGTFWNTLGAAYYRAGSWKEAVGALEQSMELRKGGDSFDWFFLAMAHWRQGNHDEARKTYDKAAEWMEKNKETLEKNNSQAEELHRFRSEAEEVLELKKK
jgi:tetratricopeptide (TPR) repeat protein/serine/threonine protein kinase